MQRESHGVLHITFSIVATVNRCIGQGEASQRAHDQAPELLQGGMSVQRAGPVLVYSIYRSDLPGFQQLLARELPDARIFYASSPQEAAPYLDDAVILYGWGFPPDMPGRMPKLRWVQKMGAGVDELIEEWPSRGNIILTRTAGKLIAPRMAEYVVCAILDKALRFDLARAQQRQRSWQFFEIGTMRDLTIGVAGLGEIGTIIAQAQRALGARVLGWNRSGRGSSSVDELFGGSEALPRFLAACDVVVLVLPLTKETRSLFNADVLACCRRGTHIINVGRGGLLDEVALLGAIEAGLVSHATLDVLATEPLPPDHPFWDNPRITITPHVCGPLIPDDVVSHFLANYRAFATGQPMQNLIDPKRQY
jgi:glyoxylate/hydroxypyruvate reductase A